MNLLKSQQNLEAYKALKKLGYDERLILNFLLSASGFSQSYIAQTCRLSHQFVSQVIAGKKESKKVKEAIFKALGFNPWAL